MRILFAASEVYPFSKTGGLADVAGALPDALARLGHEVLVISPWYRTVKGGTPLWIGDIEIPFDGSFSRVGVGTLERDGVSFAFVGHQDFQRDDLYGYSDDVYRFCRFTRAVPQVAQRLGFTPELVHVHDWHLAYLPMVLQHGWHLPPAFPGLPSVFTIHNAQYQGESELEETLYWLRLPAELRESSMYHFDRANALKAGCGFAQQVTTVSPSYARELTSAEYGYGLEGTFHRLGDRLTGIVNGIATEVWNPASDEYLVANYDIRELGGKLTVKEDLCGRAGLDPGRPLLGLVSRLAEQKGIDIFVGAAGLLVDQGWSLFILGSGDRELERSVAELSGAVPQIAAVLEYDERLAHAVYGGSDALAVPSRFEPCGLSQLIAMRYGTLPIARATGGLRDTIEHGVTGFLFSDFDPASLVAAAQEAVNEYGTANWARMISAAMSRDFSWQRSAQEYDRLYHGVIEGTRAARRREDSDD